VNIKTWNAGMSDKETADLAYWERNVLALRYAEGWYYDDVVHERGGDPAQGDLRPRYEGWRRVLCLEEGTITFHIPDDFDVGDLRMIDPNWDGHTTEEKWRRILRERNCR
jgi:hypothetical protein